MTDWKRMTETKKPSPGFIYQCEAGHEWFVPLDKWEDRGNNRCAECANA